jgi:hypothetical protein
VAQVRCGVRTGRLRSSRNAPGSSDGIHGLEMALDLDVGIVEAICALAEVGEALEKRGGCGVTKLPSELEEVAALELAHPGSPDGCRPSPKRP